MKLKINDESIHIQFQTTMNNLKGTYWLTRIYYLHFLGFLYFTAFFIAYYQNSSLLGEKGLTPATLFLTSQLQDQPPVLQQPDYNYDQNENDFIRRWKAFLQLPTVYWWIPPIALNQTLLACLGMTLSIIPMISGGGNSIVFFLLWILYLSIINIGQVWYSFGWESHLVEVGFLSIFLVPLWSLHPFPSYNPTPWIVIWGNRWLLFRIMFGAGLIKIRSDPCWLDLTCMNYHYQTQPIPNPFSIYYHNHPEWFHKAEVVVNHFVELIAPFLLLTPWRSLQMIGGIIQIIFQLTLISSGNLAFLNWLTMLSAIMCFDDAFWALWTPRSLVRAAKQSEEKSREAMSRCFLWQLPCVWARPAVDTSMCNTIITEDKTKEKQIETAPSRTFIMSTRIVLEVVLFCVLAWGSYPVVLNLLSPNQVMNMVYSPFRLVNAYGYFGTITRQRTEIVLQGTRDVVLGPHTKWKEIEFPCKPTNLDKKPCWITPYHMRLDWLMWFASFQSYPYCPWIPHLGYLLLQGDLGINSILGVNPFYNSSSVREIAVKYQVPLYQNSSDVRIWRKLLEGEAPFYSAQVRDIVKRYYAPRYVRAMLYEYEFAPLAKRNESLEDAHKLARSKGWEVGRWYKRRLLKEYMPVISLQSEVEKSLRHFLRAHRLIEQTEAT